jgi:hypothetical protein
MSSGSRLSHTRHRLADGVVVGLIDTAVQANSAALGGSPARRLALSDYQPPADGITHGTAMAETILDGVSRPLQEQSGVNRAWHCRSCRSTSMAATDDQPFDVARGSRALNRHANVINMSPGAGDSPWCGA